jgi:hypothetical protein
MSGTLDHGPRLTGEEYDRRIVALQEGMPSAPTAAQQRDVRRAELELAIDHRLGRDFPRERRDALWQVNRRIDRKWIRLYFKYVLRRIFTRGWARESRGLAGYVVGEYAKALNRDELRSFFGEKEVRDPGLPLSNEQHAEKHGGAP